MRIRGLALVVILFLGIVPRFYKLGDIPRGFFCDEAAIGYNAYKILTTGKDEYGKSFPIFFRSFGDYKNPVPIYSVIPLVAFLGLNELAVRLASVIYGAGGVAAIYLLTREIFDGYKERGTVALVSAFLLAISPWHIQFSRVGTEYISFVFWTMLAVWLWIKGLKTKGWVLILGATVSILAFYTYHPAKLFIPLILLATGWIYSWREIKRSRRLLVVGMLFMGLIPFLKGMQNGESLARFGQLSSKDNGGIIQQIKHAMLAYANYYSPDFLFFKGDASFPGQNVIRHGVKGMGELYLFQIPLILVGLIWIVRNINKKESQVLGVWLLAYPMAAAITIDLNPLATRGIIGLVIWQIMSAIGLYVMASAWRTKFRDVCRLTYVVFIVGGIISFGVYWQLFLKYPLYSSGYWGWQSGPKEMINYYLENKSGYNSFYMDSMFNAPDIFLNFYVIDNSLRSTIQVKEPFNFMLKPRQLWGIRRDIFERTKNQGIWEVKKIVYYPSGEPAFYLTEPQRQVFVEEKR